MRAPTLLTDAEFLDLPEYPGKQELLDGELLQLPPAKKSHSALAKVLMKRLEAILDTSRIWIEAAYQMGSGRWLVPDVSVSWADQAVKEDWFQGAPMLAIEIVSRGNTEKEIKKKTRLYLENGGREVWILYPRTRIMVVSNQTGTYKIIEGGMYDCELLNCNLAVNFWIVPLG